MHRGSTSLVITSHSCVIYHQELIVSKLASLQRGAIVQVDEIIEMNVNGTK
jgi:flagellar motor switch/type III secretory pathway protein FliN